VSPLFLAPPSSAVIAHPRFAFVTKGQAFEATCLVHGGAWDIPAALSEAHRLGVARAFDAVQRGLQASLDPLDALLAGIDVLEDDPIFDAGHGSFLNEDGEVELDAGVMEGTTLQAGAVASLAAFAHPARIAAEVMRHTEHVLLVGDGAARFARGRGFVALPSEALVHAREREAHARWVASGRPSARVFFGALDSGSTAGPEPQKRGTVGAVLALRERPNGASASAEGSGPWQLFTATSTGGTPGKKKGRVGDVPVPGAGFYADNLGACVSATGWGEAFLRLLPAKRVSDLCAQGLSAQDAVERALQEVLVRTGGRGGLIAISARGDVGVASSTPDIAVRAPQVVCLG
jgi:beta-aspartyl-peptidase (threonine type)